MTIAHADTRPFYNLEKTMGRPRSSIYNRLTERLARAGAECVVVSPSRVICIDAFKARSSLPVVDLLAEVDQAVKLRGLERVGILGTRTVMETRLTLRSATLRSLRPRAAR